MRAVKQLPCSIQKIVTNSKSAVLLEHPIYLYFIKRFPFWIIAISRECAMDFSELFWYLIAILIPAAFTKTYGLYLDYSDNTEFIQQEAGYNILLQCDIKGLVNEKIEADTKIYWFFKQCREKTVGGGRCHDWMQLPCEENFCKSDLLLLNVTEEYSGLYKCSMVPLEYRSGQAIDIHLVRIYHLNVKNKILAIPKLIDAYPLNKTAIVGAQAVFQCRVQSEEHPTIKWFRRKSTSNPTGLESAAGIGLGVFNDNFNAHIVNYNGHTYELIHTAQEKHVGDEVYLSKLILNGVRLQDEGYYACVAFSYYGYKIREAYLQVDNQANIEYWSDYDANEEAYTDPREFWMLFLMPLGLAMFPLMVWLSYLAYKRRLAGAGSKRELRGCADEFTERDNCILRV
ncbi:uncharacterized protein LOC128856017 isoform X2 [Anastrepha ludens]|uniref:uncharacterized protein LOC128856017 isoform X2 n=1 Tax=Anastrepha ludens TaxID=28586 RepID=UPI0023B0EDF1|nr:uncharacterized protein LOC128856017 isoform X2 [Anastrepha ludens]